MSQLSLSEISIDTIDDLPKCGTIESAINRYNVKSTGFDNKVMGLAELDSIIVSGIGRKRDMGRGRGREGKRDMGRGRERDRDRWWDIDMNRDRGMDNGIESDRSRSRSRSRSRDRVSEMTNSSVNTKESQTSIVLNEGSDLLSSFVSTTNLEFIDGNSKKSIENNAEAFKNYIFSVDNVEFGYGPTQGGKRKRRYSLNNKRTMKRRGRVIKGGDGAVSSWLCRHASFVAGVMLLSFIGGGFWCLGTYIIPVAMKELKGVVWDYIVKVCETTAVVITNLFKTNGGVSKFIDLIVNTYMGTAVAKQAAGDVYDRLIRPPFCAIRDAIKAACCESEADKAARDSARLTASAPLSIFSSAPPEGLTDDQKAIIQQRVTVVSEAITKAITERADDVRADDVRADDDRNLAVIRNQRKALDSVIERNEAITSLEVNDAVNIISKVIKDSAAQVADEVVVEEETEGGNILSYLARNIKKTMKRRKRSHKKRSGKKINYKSHKKNSRT